MMMKKQHKFIGALIALIALGSTTLYLAQEQFFAPATPRAVAVSEGAAADHSFARAPLLSEQSNALVCGLNLDLDAPNEQGIYAQAMALDLDYPTATANTILWLEQNSSLPSCYLDKAQASAKGWRGGPLWEKLGRGTAIGGSAFENREGLLPARYNGRYFSADLDYDGKRRGAARLIYVIDATGEQDLFWITLDHYASFTPIITQQQ